MVGVADGTLRDQRRVAAAVSAPAAGTCGQNLDTALMIADGGPSGRADPTFDAHDLPIGQWAEAVWLKWLPQRSLLMLVASAKVRLVGAARVWAKVFGPAAAMVATCARIGWTVGCGQLHH